MLMDIDFDVSTAVAEHPPVSVETYYHVQQFLYNEARLLDGRQWPEWLELWTPDGMYWMPREYGQESPYDHISMCWENAVMREVRVHTLEHGRAWAQQPITHATRIVGNVMVDGIRSDGCLVVHSAFHTTAWRKDELLHLAGSYTHVLEPRDDTWRIKLKRVDLVDCDAAHGSIQLYM